MGTGIGAAIRERAGRHVNLPISDPAKPGKWHRFPCPFCGKERAAINYGLGMLVCYYAECGVTLSARPKYADHSGRLAHRFQFQVEQAVDNTKASYGRWVTKEIADLRQYAYQMLAEYDHSGQLDNWEADVSLDPDQLDRYVLRALNCDLGNWAAKLVRSKRNDNALVEDEKLKAREYGRTRKGDETQCHGLERDQRSPRLSGQDVIVRVGGCDE